MDRNKGFTIIEILVVAAVIGILAAIMVPQFSKVRPQQLKKDSGATKVIESQLSVNSLKIVDRILATLDTGNFAFKVPSEIGFKERPTLELRISKKQTEEDIKKSLRPKSNEQVESGKLQLSNKIQATLTSTDFEITSLSPDTQLISSTNTFVWIWKIKPLHYGDGSLHLSVNAILETGPYVLRSLDRDIHVTITTKDKVKLFIDTHWEYLQWSWTALFVPVFIYFWKKYGKKKKPKKK